jgi:hypothetical protein
VKLSRLVLTVIFTASLLSLPGGAGRGAAAQTNPPPPLFINASGPAVSAASADPTLARYRYVAINRPALQAVLNAFKRNPSGNALLGLAFFPDAAYTARIERVQRTFTGGYMLSGVLDGIPDSEVGLALEGKVLVGHASLPGGHYILGHTRGGVQYVGQVKRGQAPLSNDAILPPGKPEISAQGPYGDDDGSYIDVMVVYTPAILNKYGGADGVQAAIDDLVNETNQGYINSQVNQRVRVVHAEEVDYDESNQAGSPPSLQTILDQLSNYPNGADGILDQVQGLRDTYAADLVVMLVNNVDPNYAGIAWLMGNSWNTHAFEPYAYSVVTDFWYNNFYVFAHEMGHNMGAQHDIAHSGGTPGAYPYSYGYCLPGTDYHTIMAYNDPCYTTINNWSNPAVKYAGVATGVTGLEDNHLTLNNTAPIVAQFRDGPGAGEAPSTLTATANSPSQVTLHWTDNGEGETNLRVERANQAGGVWGDYSEIASLQPGTQDLQDPSVACNTPYRYRLRSYYAGDGIGFTAYSNVAEVSPSCFPPDPTGLTAFASPPLPYQVVLNWTETGGNQTGFRVERLDSGVWTSHGTTGAAVTTFTDSSVACGHDYQYRVWAYNSYGDSLLPSNSATASILPCSPASLSLTPSSPPPYQVALNWTETGGNQTGFRVERLDSDVWTSHGTTGPAVTTFTDSSVTCGHDYQYRVWAYNNTGNSLLPSNSATASILPCPPTGLSLTTVSQIRINLQWNDTSQNEDGFRIDRSPDSLPRIWGWSDTVGSNVTTYSDASLSCGTSYVYRVWAFKAGQDSISSSDEVTGATLSCTVTPSNVLALGRNRTSIRLTWTDIEGEDYYAIERLDGSTWVPFAQTKATTIVDQGLAPDTQYSYRIYAHNVNGDSPYVTVTGRTYVVEYYFPFFLKK